MKKLVYALFMGFAILMTYTFYRAGSVYDGLVEPSYYERSRDYFSTRKVEENLGLAIDPGPLPSAHGQHIISINVTTKDGPLTGAEATITAGELRSSATDKSYQMKEVSPGRYEGGMDIPSAGTWILRLDVRHKLITTERRWTISVR